ncbi:glycoside hydrolase superfamily [Thelonectria olida]|uniref:Alpha-glucuronidase n=1 Tax=Thelonectria olida TaxID=1576542 RepID=A0A9P8W9P6_9HYPO|nr:glycoside hydrolase superfamily [Thelonectria olida]
MKRLFLCLFAIAPVFAENGLDGWLRYAKLPNDKIKHYQNALPNKILTINATEGGPLETAASELQKGLSSILGLDLDVETDNEVCSSSKAIIITTVDAYKSACGKSPVKDALDEDGFWLKSSGKNVQIIGQNERGALYGAFEYLSMLGQGDFSKVAYATNPSAPIRWANQWDNLNASGTHGSIERGYGGSSIFYNGVGHVKEDLTRVPLLGRLLASIRVNALVINNVNADPLLYTDQNLKGVTKIADLLRPWGVRVGMSLNFASPQTLGGLDTFDPLDESVVQWWTDLTDDIYARIPDFVGYLVKANSEGQPGPLTYNRTLSEGANMFAKAVQPYGGVVMFRAFVYNQLDWTDWHADRANAAVEFLKPLDGTFDDNVIVQIKYGPIDFQVREPASPLFANLRETNTAIELQITQEYLGQQCHLVYLPPLWRTILDFDMRVDGRESRVRDIVSGNVFKRKLGGYAGVTNVGMDTTWLGSHLSMSNLYAFGRLAWNPTEDPQKILEDWTRLTFGLSDSVRNAVTTMSMKSWPTYEKYSGNLGIQTLTDILYAHYGPNPASQDNNGWGQWTRADRKGIGMDRTVWNGTGNAGQYPKEVASKFEKTTTTPDDLMLWFHHVPYTFKLHSGKTVIQHFYDAHYEGAQTAQTFAPTWESIKGKIDSERFEHDLFRLKYQAGHSIVWRDAISEFYRNLSGIPDRKGRVRHHPYRLEAEDMKLDGYEVVDVTPKETASNYKAIRTNSTGTATAKLNFATGTYNLAVNYYDMAGGQSTWKVYVNDKLVGTWKGDGEDKLGHWPSIYLDGHSATRITFKGVRIAKGAELRIEGSADGAEPAAVDYISILPRGIVD